MAYIRNVQAISEMNNENFELAKQYLTDEKTYQQVLRCPVGEASAWASIAKLAKEQNAPDDFIFAIDNALAITKERGLDSQFQRYQTLKASYFNL
jgi:transcriptional activator of cad operon